MRSLPRLFGLAVLLHAGVSAAGEPAPAEPDAWQSAPVTRRGGFLLGAALGFGAASVVGFPNDVTKIGYAPYYHATGVCPALTPEVWLGGALTDWLNFGIGFTGSWLFGASAGTARSLAGMFHIEVFPLFYVNDELRDVGVILDFGGGTASLDDDKGEALVDGSAASLVGAGLLWEPLRLPRMRGGPFVMGNYVWSETARRPAFFAGWRMSLYTKP